MKSRIIVIILLLLVLALSGCRRGEKSFISDTHFALGTVNTVKIPGAKAEKLIQGCFDILDSVEEKMSPNLGNSEIGAVNVNAGIKPVKVSNDTFAVIKKGLEIAALGDGYFDITIGPVVSLWGIGTDSAHVPGNSELKKALSKVDYHKVLLDEEMQTVYLKDPGMSLDLGGIAKGWAADRIQNFLVSNGVERGIINLGGNVLVIGSKTVKDPWRVGVQNPEDSRGSYIGIIEADNKAVVTSGKYERYFVENGHRYHHIFDPFTGYPVENDLISVTIVATESVVADAFSTLVFVLGRKRGMALIEEVPFVDALIVNKEHSVYTSRGLKKIFSLTDKSYRMAD
ncbi:MAG: FAD:protein FMN transferase [Spirochaetes bacterium]|nr:MAG: FAD:protein FMN transferase [Spirochaetota bacterium]